MAIGLPTWQSITDFTFLHSVDIAAEEGKMQQMESVVNSRLLNNKGSLSYTDDKFHIALSAAFAWRSLDANHIKTQDFTLGSTLRYTFPRVKTTLSVDAAANLRRGYGSSELNRNDFVLNGFISQSFLKGKLIARIEAFDLLHQLSSTQYEVNAQGRTETWYRSLPSYVMFRLVYHFNINPKKKK